MMIKGSEDALAIVAISLSFMRSNLLFNNVQSIKSKSKVSNYSFWFSNSITAAAAALLTLFVINQLEFSRMGEDISAKNQLNIAMSSKEQKAFIEQCKYDSTGPIYQMLSDVDAEKSDAYNPDDKERIHTVIREEIGFAGLNSMLFKQLREWVITVGLKELKLSEEDSEEQMAFMNMVGTLYRDQGKYDLAEPLYEESFSKHEKKLGSDHSSTLESMNNRYKNRCDLRELCHCIYYP